MERAARQFFSIPSNIRLKFFSKFANDEFVEIVPDVWPYIYEIVTSIWVEAVDRPASVQNAQSPQVGRPGSRSPATSNDIKPRRGRGKPVIYLYPSTPTSINVCLSLVNGWEFLAIYPLVPVKRSEFHSGEIISWDVFAEPDGKLRLSDGLEVSYLYWEAE